MLNYKVIDGIFTEFTRCYLQKLALSEQCVNMNYKGGYRASDFDGGCHIKMHPQVLKEIRDKIPVLKELKYIRSWSFIYDSQCNGVNPHADPSLYNLNVWVTPDECVEDWNKNGLKIYDIDSENLSYYDYNHNIDLINERIKNSKWDVIPYKCNRGVLFPGRSFHATDRVYMKPGSENRRINYTFLFEL
jgi:hypothetical protein